MTAPDPRAWLDAVNARTNAATDDVRFGVLVEQARTDLPAATAALRAVLDLLDQVEGEDEWALVHTDDIRAAITTALEDA